MTVLDLIRSAPGDALVRDIVATPVERSLLFAELVAHGGSHMAGYVMDDSTCADVLHWIDLSEPPEAGRHTAVVALRPLLDDDLGSLYLTAFGPSSGQSWRFRGRTAPFSAFYDDLHVGVLAQFAAVGVDDGHVYGMVVAYQAMLDQGHCYVAFLRSSTRRSEGEMSHAMFLLIEHLFRCFALRKVYAEIPGFNVAGVGFPADVFAVEGRLVEHDFFEGRYWDRLVIATTRARWDAFAEPLRSVVLGS